MTKRRITQREFAQALQRLILARTHERTHPWRRRWSVRAASTAVPPRRADS
jgi:hypothetical protein